MDENKKVVCDGCGDELKKDDLYVEIGEVVFCEYCIGHNWHSQD